MSQHNKIPPPSFPPPPFAPRTRVYLACAQCRRRKIRCISNGDYDKPCERCDRRNLRCEYISVAEEAGREYSSSQIESTSRGPDDSASHRAFEPRVSSSSPTPAGWPQYPSGTALGHGHGQHHSHNTHPRIAPPSNAYVAVPNISRFSQRSQWQQHPPELSQNQYANRGGADFEVGVMGWPDLAAPEPGWRPQERSVGRGHNNNDGVYFDSTVGNVYQPEVNAGPRRMGPASVGGGDISESWDGY
ncbi:hypothetical protein FB45DRAFT_1126220 [Roridomyces roridus]|uniref:Zn(2)-C6 fungal-type domain-containing protein n=1 Tax=Roridomyces roridus TaxID=1738132 RepID=A0AAD7CAM6_9AGAR|nr:hypothetical protein FB45DRAFT_1126220 [Roridomyces roridus]